MREKIEQIRQLAERRWHAALLLHRKKRPMNFQKCRLYSREIERLDNRILPMITETLQEIHQLEGVEEKIAGEYVQWMHSVYAGIRSRPETI